MDKYMVLVTRNDMIKALFDLLEIQVKKDDDLTLTKEQLALILRAIQDLKSKSK